MEKLMNLELNLETMKQKPCQLFKINNNIK